jgi:hypothetical protein
MLSTHPDGCITPNMVTHMYRAIIVPKCDHAKVRGMVVDFMATSHTLAAEYVQQWLVTPKTQLQRVYKIDPETVICRKTEV